jgi:uncharacterized protein (DUF2147 family)
MQLSFKRSFVLLVAVPWITGAAPPPPDPSAALLGIWSNPTGHVRIRITQCEPHLCGTIVYASDQAKADAAKAGTADLIGLNLFQQLSLQSDGDWRGRVLVPDLSRTVDGRIHVIDTATLNIEGCMFGHLACKDQKWSRIN